MELPNLKPAFSKCSLFAAAVLRPILCGLIVTFCPENFFNLGLRYPCHFEDSSWFNRFFKMPMTAPILMCALLAKSFLEFNQLILLQKYSNLQFQKPHFVLIIISTKWDFDLFEKVPRL